MILPMEFDPFLGEEVYPKDQLGPSCGFDSVFLQDSFGSPVSTSDDWDPGWFLGSVKLGEIRVFFLENETN